MGMEMIRCMNYCDRKYSKLDIASTYLRTPVFYFTSFPVRNTVGKSVLVGMSESIRSKKQWTRAGLGQFLSRVPSVRVQIQVIVIRVRVQGVNILHL